MNLFMLLFTLLFSSFTAAEAQPHSETPAPRAFWLSLEAGPVWQSVNRVQIPSDTGTRFSLTDFGSSGGITARIYFGYRFQERHELRALYAPLSLTLTGTSNQAIQFQGKTFSNASPLEGYYKFNSYRLTYRYLIHQSEKWTLKLGFTAKVRDAEIRLTQGAVTASRANVGLVPLLHFAATYNIHPLWFLSADLDALAAPQGRAEDLALTAGYQFLPELAFTAGYRTVEGGSSDGGGVYSFAWLHYAIAGMVWEF